MGGGGVAATRCIPASCGTPGAFRSSCYWGVGGLALSKVITWAIGGDTWDPPAWAWPHVILPAHQDGLGVGGSKDMAPSSIQIGRHDFQSAAAILEQVLWDRHGMGVVLLCCQALALDGVLGRSKGCMQYIFTGDGERDF